MALTDDSEIKLMGNMGCYLDENNIISFQTGMSLSVADTPDFAPDNIVWRQPPNRAAAAPKAKPPYI